MASKHEQIVNQLMIDWSECNRGRLFKNHTGGAWTSTRIDNEYYITDKNKRQFKVVTLWNANFIKYGLRAGDKKFTDLVGFEFFILYDKDGNEVNIAVFTCIEVKTFGYKTLTDEQKDCLNMCVNFGGRAYVAMETEDGYFLERWENGTK